MRIATSLLALCAVGAYAGEAPTIAEMHVADSATLNAHWDASIYHQVWQDPALAEMRAAFDQALAEVKAEHGIDLRALIDGFGGMHGRLDQVELKPGATPDAKPQVTVRARLIADLGAQAKLLLTLMAKNAGAKLAPAQAAGADAAFSPTDLEPGMPSVTLARFANALQVAVGQPAQAMPVPKAPADVALRINMTQYAKVIDQALALAGPAQPELAGMRDMMASFTKDMRGDMHWTAEIVPEGIRERITTGMAPIGMQAVDLQAWARLPAATMCAIAAGYDGKAIWREYRSAALAYATMMMAAMQGGEPKLNADPAALDATEQQLNELLAGVGLNLTTQQLVEGLSGTFLFGVAPSGMVPGVTIAIPRTLATDTLVTFGLKQIDQAPPALGEALNLALPGMALPFALMLVQDEQHWWLTTDLAVPDALKGGQPGGWADTPAAKLALTLAGKNPVLLGASDTPRLLRTLAGYLAMAPLPNDKRQLKGQLLQGINRLAAKASTGYLFSRGDANASLTEARGLIGLGVVPYMSVIAAIAIPNLLESRVTANEAAASSTLRAGIFPAQVQFQGGAYQDHDQDNVGEYGFIAELTGASPTGKMEASALKLITGPLATGPLAIGYRFTVFLPDGAGGAVGEPKRGEKRQALAATVENANDQERYFLAYAWPEKWGETGRKIFVIAHDGQVRSPIGLDELKAVLPAAYQAQADREGLDAALKAWCASGEPPAWKAALGEAGWNAATPAWSISPR